MESLATSKEYDDPYEYVADARPISPSHTATEKSVGDPESDEESDDSIDKILRTPLPAKSAGDFRVENSSVEIANSSSVQFGNNVTQKTNISFKRATSVVVDQRQYFYETPSSSSRLVSTNDERAEIVENVRDVIQRRYRDRLGQIFLPWNTRFTLQLEKIYTNLQLSASDGFDGRTGPITMEHIFDEKQGELTSSYEGRPRRVLIEGNPGYGKTTLTLKLASDWAVKKEYINRFQLVFLIPLRQFQGDLQSYIFQEFFPQHEDQGRDDWWHYVKENHRDILFILDGLDELSVEHRNPIDMLLKGNLLEQVSVIVTSRTLSSDDPVISFFDRRIEIRGFGQLETEQFIHNYFQLKRKPQQISKLTSLLNGPRWCGRHLTSCPLTCLLLCNVFEAEGDEGILHKLTEIYQGLIGWLVRRATGKSGTTDTGQARDYERALSDFGLLCLEALSKGETQFTDEQLETMPNKSGQLILKLGLLIERSTTNLCIAKKVSYQPIHKTFLEYITALYLSGSVEKRLVRHFGCFQSDTLTRESLNLIFKFLAGLLGQEAAVLFRCRHLSAFQFSMITLFELLHESGSTPENVRALSSILHDEVVIVNSSRVELDGWAGLLAEPDCPIRSLKFIWTDTPLNQTALDRFFTAFQTNRSVECLVIGAARGLSPDANDVVAMGAFTKQALKKTQLRHFSLHLVGDTWATQVVTAVNSMLDYRYAASLLTTMKINVDLGTQQVAALCQGLRHSNVKSLVLSKLSCSPEGYLPIASLLKSLRHLSLSLSLIKALPDKTEIVNGDRHEVGSPKDLQMFDSYFKTSAQQRAGITVQSMDRHRPSSESTSTSSSLLYYLEDNLSPTNNKVEEGLRLPGVAALQLLKPYEPECDGDHLSGFHSLFTALQDPECQLTTLDLTGCYLGPADLKCLGQALRNGRSVRSLRLANLKSFDEVFPVLIRSNLSWLDLSSSFISIDDDSAPRLLFALSTTTKLVALSLARWEFRIQNPKTVEVFDLLLRVNTLQELNLTGCRFHCWVRKLSPTLSFASLVTARTTGPSDSSLNSSDDTYREKGHLKEKEFWPNLVKVSLSETVLFVKTNDSDLVQQYSGPKIFIPLDRLVNLTELSVSLRPTIDDKSPHELDDYATKKFFSTLRKRLGHTLKKLRMSFCRIVWHRPAATSAHVIRQLRKCEKLASLELNSVQFSVATEHEHHEPIHQLLDTVVRACVQLEELSLIGMALNDEQAYHLGVQISKRWRGQSLQVHTWRTGHDEQHTEHIVARLLDALKNHPESHSKLQTEYLGGYRGTVLVRRKKNLCGLFRNIKVGVPNLLPRFNFSTRSGDPEDGAAVDEENDELRSTLPPGQRSLFGLTPFDYSIMLAHTWESNKS